MDYHKLIVAIVVFVALSCGVQKPPQPSVIIQHDTTIRERIIHDTARFEVPVEIEKIVTRDTASHLENRFGMSDAIVSQGFLSHSLQTKPQIIKIPVNVEVHDTTVVYKQAETKIEYVEKKLTWWQEFRLKGFWWLLGICVGLLIYIFRKPIWAFIKAFF